MRAAAASFLVIPILTSCRDGATAPRLIPEIYPATAVSPASVTLSNVLLYVSDEFGGSTVVAMNSDGASVRRLTTSGDLARPDVAPNARRVAFTQWWNGGSRIVIANADGSNMRPFPQTTPYDLSPVWSPDGRNVAFYGRVDTPYGIAGRVFIADVETLRVRQLSLNPGPSEYWFDRGPSWSPDGSEIVYHSNGSLVRAHADGSAHVTIPFPGAFCQEHAWSRQVDRLACTSNVFATGQWQLVTLRPDGGDLRVLAVGAPQTGAPNWSPDGRHIAFTKVVNGYFTIFRIGADGTGERQLTEPDRHREVVAWERTLVVPWPGSDATCRPMNESNVSCADVGS